MQSVLGPEGACGNHQECGTGGKKSILGIHGGWKLVYVVVCTFGQSCHNVCVNILSVCMPY